MSLYGLRVMVDVAWVVYRLELVEVDGWYVAVVVGCDCCDVKVVEHTKG